MESTEQTDMVSPQIEPPLKWIKQSEQPCPMDTRVIWTDGTEMVIGLIRKMERSWLVNSPYYYSENPEGIDGYEWECTVKYENITHWMLAPDFPR